VLFKPRPGQIARRADAPDQERGRSPGARCSASASGGQRIETAGHSFGALDLLATGAALLEIIDALTERGLVVEGEPGHELTAEGEAAPVAVRRGSCGPDSKLVNRFNVELHFTFFGGG